VTDARGRMPPMGRERGAPSRAMRSYSSVSESMVRTSSSGSPRTRRSRSLAGRRALSPSRVALSCPCSGRGYIPRRRYGPLPLGRFKTPRPVRSPPNRSRESTRPVRARLAPLPQVTGGGYQILSVGGRGGRARRGLRSRRLSRDVAQSFRPTPCEVTLSPQCGGARSPLRKAYDQGLMDFDARLTDSDRSDTGDSGVTRRVGLLAAGAHSLLVATLGTARGQSSPPTGGSATALQGVPGAKEPSRCPRLTAEPPRSGAPLDVERLPEPRRARIEGRRRC
jgi:hypothetical protein